MCFFQYFWKNSSMTQDQNFFHEILSFFMNTSRNFSRFSFSRAFSRGFLENFFKKCSSRKKIQRDSKILLEFFFWNSIRYSDFFLCTSSPKVLLATASESIPCHFSIFFKRNSSMNTRRGSINSSKNNCIQKFILWKIPPCFNILQEICALF